MGGSGRRFAMVVLAFVVLITRNVAATPKPAQATVGTANMTTPSLAPRPPNDSSSYDAIAYRRRGLFGGGTGFLGLDLTPMKKDQWCLGNDGHGCCCGGNNPSGITYGQPGDCNDNGDGWHDSGPCYSCMGAIKDCDNKNCGTNQYRSGYCHCMSNKYTCHACSNIDCGPDRYRSGSCGGTTNSYTCHACNHLNCGADQYRSGYCGGTSNGYSCTPCPLHTTSYNGAKRPADCVVRSDFYGAPGATPKACPVHTTSSTGAKKPSDCTARAGYYGAPGKPATECPSGTSPSKAGATSMSMCLAKAGHYNTGVVVAACPPHTLPSLAGATSLSECRAVSSYFNTGVLVKACPSHSTGPAGATSVAQCTCDDTFYDTDFEDGVTCEGAPARIANVANSPCNMAGMGFGLQTAVTAESSMKRKTQLGVMVTWLGNVTHAHGVGNVLAKANYNDACQQLFVHANTAGGLATLCGHRVDLFAYGASAKHPKLLGVASLQCHGHSGLYSLMQTCSSTCMSDKQSSCCFVPDVVAWMFPWRPGLNSANLNFANL